MIIVQTLPYDDVYDVVCCEHFLSYSIAYFGIIFVGPPIPELAAAKTNRYVVARTQ